ncbi:MAG: hypothetical protein HY471_00845 [Candidatus Sungbacteria bacterium]|nr:hypothetical protein [Candidatus Sungbacteria bacterium]
MPKLNLTPVLAIILLGFLLISARPSEVRGQASTGRATDGRMLFGGKIQQTRICTCPVYAFLWIRVNGPPIGRDIVLTWSSLQYLHYAYQQGNWTRGDAGPTQVQCLDVCKKGCCNSGYQGFPVIHIGTTRS